MKSAREQQSRTAVRTLNENKLDRVSVDIPSLSNQLIEISIQSAFYYVIPTACFRCLEFLKAQSVAWLVVPTMPLQHNCDVVPPLLLSTTETSRVPSKGHGLLVVYSGLSPGIL